MARQCASKSYQKASIVKGHHIYKVIWTPEIGEELPVNCEYGNEHDEHVLKDGEIVGHLLRTILRVLWFFLRRGGRIIWYCATPLAFIRDPAFISYTVGLTPGVY